MQQCLRALVERDATLNTSKLSSEDFARWASVQISVMLAHTRRVQCCTLRYQQALSSLPETSQASFDQLMHDCSS
eukprot:4742693-Lingulodinium_polyedra.AAC.1